jgi:hypothetical protein
MKTFIRFKKAPPDPSVVRPWFKRVLNLYLVGATFGLIYFMQESRIQKPVSDPTTKTIELKPGFNSSKVQPTHRSLRLASSVAAKPSTATKASKMGLKSRSVVGEQRYHRVYVPSKTLPLMLEKKVVIDPALHGQKFLSQLILRTGVHRRLTGIMLHPIRSSFVYENTLVVDLKIGYQRLFQATVLRTVQNLYTLVNTLLENVPQERVLFLFKGKALENVEGPLDLSQPLRFNPALVRSHQS